MSSTVQQMTYTAMTVRLRQLTAELTAAAEAGDLSRVSRADHALRNAAIALVGGGSLLDSDAEERMAVLMEALQAVQQAVRVMSQRAETSAGQARGNLVYLRMDRHNKGTAE